MDEIKVMVNGPPGNMAKKAAEYVAKADNLVLFPYAFTGPEISDKTITVEGNEITLVKPSEREDLIAKLKEENNLPDISVEFTHPDSINDNVDFYCRHKLPSVVGTTGGDRKALEDRVRNSETIAVIAPNMAKQIVAFQAVMQDFADEHEGKWVNNEKGLYIRESHQCADVTADFKGKADTSGTAKAVVEYFNKIGLPYDANEIVKIRDVEDQLALGVPRWALKAHGWHRYKLYTFGLNEIIVDDLYETVFNFLNDKKVFENYTRRQSKLSGEQQQGYAVLSPDKNFIFRVEYRIGETKIDHNMNGRDLYAAGTMDAIHFNSKNCISRERQSVFND